MLQWIAGMTACILMGLGAVAQWAASGIGHAEESNRPDQEMTIETWMNEWMSVSKAPGGIIKLSRFREPIYFLTDQISWSPNRGQEAYTAVTVPAGFVTDFASIPRIFWSALRPDGQYAYAAVIHDYLYWTQTRPRDEADIIFKMAMEDFEIGSMTVGAIYHAIRLFGQEAWTDNARKKDQGEKRLLARFPQDPRMKWEDWKNRPGVFAP